MTKQKSIYECQKCGAQSPKWAGRCSQCGEWNSLVETMVSTKSKKTLKKTKSTSKPVSLKDVGKKKFSRTKTKISELDRVLGGGVVSGSISLLAGEPGIGKSTLLTQLALELTSRQSRSGKNSKDRAVLYVCGEESPEQIKMRIERLAQATSNKKQETIKKPKSYTPKSPSLNSSNLLFLPQTDVDVISAVLENQVKKLSLIIVDSIQTLKTDDLTGMAGSVGQVRECSYRLQQVAKKTGLPIVLVGHVTKGGEIAGPKVLEHLVDVVLQLEGDTKHDFRVLRSRKNRFGPVDEVGIFQMLEQGMKEVKNPSDLFLEERQKNVPGSAIVATMEGTRPMLVEVQALANPTNLAVPRRIANGIDRNRMQMLTGVLSRRANLKLGSWDIYVNIAGGMRIEEPAVDLAVCLAIASAYKNKPLKPKTVCIGEVGLLGEVRKVRGMKKRTKEAKKMGYTKVVGDKEKSLIEAIKAGIGK